MAPNFTKGMQKPAGSGRKKGQPHKLTEEVRKLARKHGPEIIERLATIAKSSTDEKAATEAGKVVLDRAYGRASPLPLDDATSNVGGIKVIIMGDDAKL